MQPTRLDAYNLLQDGILAFARAEQIGIRIDTEYCQRKKTHLTRKIVYLENEFKESNFYKHWKHVYGEKTNIGSNPQLADFLYKIKKIEPPSQTRKGRGSTDEETLLQLNIPEVNSLIAIDKLKKLRDVYLDAFVREQIGGILHPFFNLHTVKTYRSSSDSPNFQNIPKRDEESMLICRRALFPRKGHQIGEADFSGAEVRVGQCYHNDPMMYKYIMDHTTDMHRDMAQELFKVPFIDKKLATHYTLRQAAKNGFVFPQFYGSYYFNCAINLVCSWGKLGRGQWSRGEGIPMPKGTLSDHLMSVGIKSFDQFVNHVKDVEYNFWNKRFKVYKQWKDQWWTQYQRDGHFDLLTGFRCSGVMKKNDVTNYPIQGSAFHCLLWAFIEIDRISREEGWDTKLIGQIHDSIVFDINPGELDYVMKTVRRVICEDLPKAWNWITVPIDVDEEICEIDQPWSTKQPYKLAA